MFFFLLFFSRNSLDRTSEQSIQQRNNFFQLSATPKKDLKSNLSQKERNIKMETGLDTVSNDFSQAQQIQHSLLRITTPVKKTRNIKPQGIVPHYLENVMSKINMDDYQKEAVIKDPDKPLMIFAGAGSGKTRTMCARIAYLLSRTYPSKILGITV